MKKMKQKPITPQSRRLGRFLRFWRNHRHWALKKPAEELGVHGSTWSRWERGVRFPGPELLEMLARYLGIFLCRLITGRRFCCPRCVRQRA